MKNHDEIQVCLNCRFYVQHYYRNACGNYTYVYAGHCTGKRYKMPGVAPGQYACDKFEMKEMGK